MLAFRRVALDLIARGGQRGDETDALALALDVVVAPFPLVTGDFDGNVGIGGVLLRNHGLGHGPRDDHEDDHRDDRPDDLDGGVLVEMSGLVADRLAVRVNRPEHEAEHANEDEGHERHDPLVQAVDILGELRRRRLQVPGHRLRAPGRKRRRERAPIERRGQQTGRRHAWPIESHVLPPVACRPTTRNAPASTISSRATGPPVKSSSCASAQSQAVRLPCKHPLGVRSVHARCDLVNRDRGGQKHAEIRRQFITGRHWGTSQNPRQILGLTPVMPTTFSGPIATRARDG